MDDPTCFSLFSGIGGMDEGLRRAGFRHVAFAESDPWRRSVLAHHWPGVPIYEDVVDVGQSAEGPRSRRLRAVAGESGDEHPVASGWIGSEHVDLLCGGFPCQDVSVAGRRAGLAGDRSGLFYEFARIAESLRPRWILVENVPGLLSSNGGRDFGAVLGTLADIGYGVAWRILDSRYFGVPQRRRRVFVLGALAVGDPRGAAERAGELLAVGSRCERHPTTRREAGETVAYASADGAHGSRVAGTFGALTGGMRSTDLDGNGAYVTDVVHALNLRGREHGANPELDDLASLRAASGGSSRSYVADTSVRRLTPTECERLQALPDGWTAHGPDSRRYAALGDAVTASVAEFIGRRLIRAETST